MRSKLAKQRARKTRCQEANGCVIGNGCSRCNVRTIDRCRILILMVPRLLSFIVAIYLIIVGLIGLNAIHHFIR